MKKSLLLALICSVAFLGCKREQQFSRFNTNILAPLAHTSLGLKNLVGDSILVPDPDGALRLANSYVLYDGDVNELFSVPDTTNSELFKLQSLELADQVINESVPLFLVFPAALTFNGQNAPIPAQTASGLPPVQVDGSQFFEEATLQSGSMEVTIQNGFPVEIEEIIFSIKNAVDNTIITEDTFRNIPPGGSQTRIADLAGKTVYADMLAEAKYIQTAASAGSVLIDAYAEAILNIAVKDLKPYSAIAKFPPQSVIEKNEKVVYNFNSSEVKEVDIKQGNVTFRVVSTIEEEMTANYELPNMVKDGQPFSKTFVIPAASLGKPTNLVLDYSLAGYNFNLRGENPAVDDTVNTYRQSFKVTLDSSGINRRISLDDSVFFYFGVVDVIPEYVEGYFGSEEIKLGPETIDFGFLNNTSGNISFEDIDVSLRMQNGIGAEAEARINSIIARNTAKGSALQLTGPGLAGPHLLPAATFPPFMRSSKVINLNSGNSNIKEFFELFPDKIDYDVVIQTNPNGNNGLYQDFIIDESDFQAILDVDIPMSVQANELTLEDTLTFDFANLERSAQIVEGNLNLVADNGFPLEAKIQVYLLNQNDFIIDSLVVDKHTIEAGTMDANKRVAEPKRSVVVAEVPLAKMPNLRTTKKVIVRVIMNTPPTGYWKLYENYTFDLSITGDFIYDQNN